MSTMEHLDQERDRIGIATPDMRGVVGEAMLAAELLDWNVPVGRTLIDFERAVAERAGTEDAMATVSRSAALHLGLRVLGVIRGDTVLMPTFAPVSAAGAVRQVGAVPYLLDSEPHTGNVDPVLLASTIEYLSERDRKPAAIIVVDAYGNCADFDLICDVCDSFDVPILEDASLAIGSTYRNQPAGSFGDVGVYSFGTNNLISTGTGGALVGSRPFIERAKALGSQSSDDLADERPSEMGFTYRMPEVLAAVGRPQLARLDERIATAHDIHDRYVAALGDIAGLHVYTQTGFGRGNGLVTVIGLNERTHPEPQEIIQAMSAVHGIEARRTWTPLHHQSLFVDCERAGGDVAERLHRQGLCLPSGTALETEAQDRVVEALRTSLGFEGTGPMIDVDGNRIGTAFTSRSPRLLLHGDAEREEQRQNDASSATSEQSGDHVLGA